MRRLTLFLILIVLASGGCSRGLGPRNLAPDRTAYIEALGDSWKEQLLFNIVKLRYGDALTFLDVSGITQSYTLDATANAGYILGWGEGTTTSSVTAPPVGGPTTTSSRMLNLFPNNTFNAGISSSYRTFPTITYTPFSGEVIKEAIFTRLSPIMIFKALDAAWEPDFIIPYCCASINNVKGISPEMSELVVCWKELNKKKAISITIEEAEEVKDAKNNEGENGKPDTKVENTKGPKPKDKGNLEGLANNLVEFTSNLVKKQKEEAPTKKEAAFITLDKNKAPDDVKNFKKLLDLDRTEKLKEKFRGVLIDEGLDSEMFNKLEKFAGLDKTQISLKKKIRESLGLMPKELTSQEKEEIRAIGHGELLEKYQVVEGIPPKKGNLDKIYVRSRSVYQVLTMLANFIDVPDSHKTPPSGESWVWPKTEREWYEIPHFQVRSEMGLTRPNEFAAIKYKGHWFYIPNGDPDTKRVFSGLVGIFSMMKSAPSVNPILTIPVR